MLGGYQLVITPGIIQGFIQKGGSPGIPPPRNLEAEYGYYLMLLNVCVIKVLIGILSQIASEAI